MVSMLPGAKLLAIVLALAAFGLLVSVSLAPQGQLAQFISGIPIYRADTTGQSIPGFDQNPTISGTVSLVQTLGARPPNLGQVSLAFTGTGSSAGQNYAATTNVNGAYSLEVLAGWTGTITAADPNRVILFPASTPIGPINQNTTQNLTVWVPPIGIPALPFGIEEQAPTYSQTNPLHYYVRGPTGCSDSTSNNGGRGSPSNPRCTIPTTLQAGAYVEVHGGRIAITI